MRCAARVQSVDPRVEGEPTGNVTKGKVRKNHMCKAMKEGQRNVYGRHEGGGGWHRQVCWQVASRGEGRVGRVGRQLGIWQESRSRRGIVEGL